jgi:hypothetical protein
MNELGTCCNTWGFCKSPSAHHSFCSTNSARVVRKKRESLTTHVGEVMKIHVETAQADSYGATRSIQAWPRPLGSRSGDADEAATAPAHPLVDRVRLALTPYGAVLGCNRCSTSSKGFANGLHSAGSPSQDTRAVGSQSVAPKRICFRAPVRCFQHSEPQVGDRRIERLSIDTVAVMNEEPIRMVRGDCLAQLLQRPSCRRIRRHIPMEKTA